MDGTFAANGRDQDHRFFPLTIRRSTWEPKGALDCAMLCFPASQPLTVFSVITHRTRAAVDSEATSLAGRRRRSCFAGTREALGRARAFSLNPSTPATSSRNKSFSRSSRKARSSGDRRARGTAWRSSHLAAHGPGMRARFAEYRDQDSYIRWARVRMRSLRGWSVLCSMPRRWATWTLSCTIPDRSFSSSSSFDPQGPLSSL